MDLPREVEGILKAASLRVYLRIDHIERNADLADPEVVQTLARLRSRGAAILEFLDRDWEGGTA